MKADLKALFWKEWRENIRWAVLALLCLSAALVYAVYYEASRAPYSNDGAVPLWSSVTLFLTIGAPLAGLSLGLLQILPEQRRDQWAFLVHRPVSRTALFFGKAVPGLSLYLLAVSLPLLGFALWDAVPGHVAAPFDFRFTLGGWAAILTGAMFYFAGLLTALRPARWFGRNPLPLVAALAAPVTTNWFGEFWQAALVCLVLAGVFGFAAWGSFVAFGEYARQAKPSRFLLGSVAYIGILGIILLLISVSFAVKESLFPLPESMYQSTQYQIEATGRVLRVTQDRNGDMLKIADLAGSPLAPPAHSENAWTGSRFLRTFDLVPHWYWQSSSRYSEPSAYVFPLQTFLYHAGDTAWYYLYRTHQIEGYSERTKRRVAFLGPLGFSKSRDMAGRFPESLSNTDHQNNTGALLLFPHSAYRFDTDNEALTKLWPDSLTAQSRASASSVDGACYLQESNFASEEDALAIAADGRIQVFAGTGKPLFDLPRAYPASLYPNIVAAMNPSRSRFYFWYSAKDNGWPSTGYSPAKIVAVTSRGQVVQTTTLPTLTPLPHEELPPAAGLVVPPGLIAAYAGVEGLLDAAGNPNAKIAWEEARHETGILGELACSALAGVIAAVLVWFLSRRCGDESRGQSAWAFGVFWLGIYGVLLLPALREWPARVRCPNCGRLRAVDRTACEHCGAAFARPLQDGTEIFDAEEISNDGSLQSSFSPR